VTVDLSQSKREKRDERKYLSGRRAGVAQALNPRTYLCLLGRTSAPSGRRCASLRRGERNGRVVALF